MFNLTLVMWLSINRKNIKTHQFDFEPANVNASIFGMNYLLVFMNSLTLSTIFEEPTINGTLWCMFVGIISKIR